MQLESIIKNFRPTVVVFVGIFFIPIELVILCKEKNIIVTAWAGDSFGHDQEKFKPYIDFLYVSDSAMLNKADEIGFENNKLLQFGYNPKLHFNYKKNRDSFINFIGSYTQDRDDIFSYLTNYNLQIEGIKWDKLKSHSSKWKVRNRKLNQSEVADIYNSTVGTLNVAQKENVVNMVNMRTFEAIASGSCILNDYVEDIELCFEPNKEILVYRNIDELLEFIPKVLTDKKYVEYIVQNGIRRMEKSGYSYKDRAKYILSNIN